MGGALCIATLGRQTGLSAATLFSTGLNAAPPAVLVLGLAVLGYGIAPRWTAGIGYGVVAWSFLVELIGAMVAAPSWVLELSLLHHVAPAPAAARTGSTTGC